MKILLPQLSHPITRGYPWPFFTPLVLFLGLLSLGILLPLNVALTGYQVVITSSKDFYHVPFNWWNHIAPKPKPGSLCAPQNLTTSSTFWTDYGIFQWGVVSPNFTDLSVPFLSYRAYNLSGCDAFKMAVTANVLSSTVELSAFVLCVESEFPLIMRMSWSPWGGASDTDTQIVRSAFAIDTKTNPLFGSASASVLLTDAASDLLQSMRNSHNASPSTAAYTFVYSVTPGFCPKQEAGTGAFSGCADVTFSNRAITYAEALGANGGLNDVSASGTVDSAALENLFQVLHAAVRLDIGYNLPNNVLTNPAAFDANITINTGTANTLTRDRRNATGAAITYPLTSTGLAVLDLSYECTYKYRKSAAEILISVLVATASLAASGWAFLMLAAGYFAGKAPEANTCSGHHPDPPVRPSIKALSSSFRLSYGGKARKKDDIEEDSHSDTKSPTSPDPQSSGEKAEKMV